MQEKNKVNNRNKKNSVNKNSSQGKKHYKAKAKKIVTKRPVQNKREIIDKTPLKIIPLGGLDEIGKNCTVYEYEDEIIIVDCGLAFPDDEMLGVDMVIPDLTTKKKSRVYL